MPNAGRLEYLEAQPDSQSPHGRGRRTLVLLHAFPLNARMWEPQLALAEAGWHVIAPHMRGVDGGTADPAIASIDDYVGDVIDLLDALHIHEAVFAGLSMGGYVALALFRRAPRYFTGLILADTRSQPDTPEGLEGRKRTLATLREKGIGPVLDELVPKLLGASSRRNHPEIETRLREMATSNSPEAVAGMVTALMTRQDSTPLLSSIRCPSLIVVGEEDVLTPPDLSRQMHAAIAGSKLVVLPGVGHLSSLESPRAFNLAIGEFLNSGV